MADAHAGGASGPRVTPRFTRLVADTRPDGQNRVLAESWIVERAATQVEARPGRFDQLAVTARGADAGVHRGDLTPPCRIRTPRRGSTGLRGG